ncbi:MAG: WbqC family protein, partial [Candidatus Latescibacterota bacterium]
QYLPWLGYFEKIARADRFVMLDIVQFKKNEFQNRNKIKTAQGWQWLTVPVRFKFPMSIAEVPINNDITWRNKHLQALISNYTKAPFFKDYFSLFERLFQQEWQMLTDINRATIDLIVQALGITTPLDDASQWHLSNDPTGRLVDICKHLHADTYLAGAGGHDYMDLAQFDAAGIRVEFQSFTHPTYTQNFGNFEPYMSTIDLLFNHGPESLRVLLGENRS